MNTTLHPRQNPVIDSTRMIELLGMAKDWALSVVPELLGIKKIPDLLPHGRHERSRKIPLKGYFQTDGYSCGAIAGWSVLKFLKPGSSFKKFYEDCDPSETWGVSTTRLSAALRKHSVRVSTRPKMDFDAIKTSIEGGSPVLVSIDVGCEEHLHWVVIYGIGWNPRRIFISGHSIPGFSKRVIPWRQFKRSIWIPSGLGLVCSARRKPNARNSSATS